MPITFFIENETLSLINGLPPDYKKEHIIRGSDAWHYTSNELSIIIQQIKSSITCFCKLHIHFKKPVIMRCCYQYEGRVLFARAVTDHPATEYIKGGGVQHYYNKQFACVFGKNWQSLLAPEHACEYIFFDTVWNEELLEYRRKRTMLQQMDRAGDFVPHRLHAGRLNLSLHMDKMLHIFRHHNYTGDYLDFLDMNMDRYLTLTLNTISNPNYASFNIKDEHLKSVDRAITHITGNLYKDFTIPDLSRTALTNATTLKRYFPVITGFTIDDFKTYLKITPALIQLVHTQEPVKLMYGLAGYSSFSAFCAGFRKVFLCSPSEVRTEDWDISFI